MKSLPLLVYALDNRYKKYGVLRIVMIMPVGISIPKLTVRVIVSASRTIIEPDRQDVGSSSL